MHLEHNVKSDYRDFKEGSRLSLQFPTMRCALKHREFDETVSILSPQLGLHQWPGSNQIVDFNQFVIDVNSYLSQSLLLHIFLDTRQTRLPDSRIYAEWYGLPFGYIGSQTEDQLK